MTKRKMLAAALLATLAAPPALSAELLLINGDAGTGLGLEDPTPRAPVGGNPGITLGEQRQVAYAYAAQMWGSILQSDVPILVRAAFVEQPCTATGAVLGSAGASNVLRDFPGAIAPATWHHIALAESIVGVDVNPGLPDINSQFNSRINGDPACLGGADWYYGLDGETPAGSINFLNVVMHEIGHGLGFSSFINVQTGAQFLNFSDVYAANSFNSTLAKQFPAMVNVERQFAVRDNGNTVWTGAAVSGAAPDFLDGRLGLTIAGVDGLRDFANSSLGPIATPDNFGGEVVVADDGAGVGSDACEPLVNGAAVAGRLALVDRGICSFDIKVINAQAAGAVGVVVANNVPGVIAPGGANAAVTVPVIGISLADGDLIKAASPGVDLALAPGLLVGADAAGRVRLYAPPTVAPGSSFSHYDTAVSPNALMEPFINSDLRANVDVDLTPALFRDVGWNTNPGNATLGGCDTGVPVVDDNGLAVGASIVARGFICEVFASNHGKYVSCVNSYANDLARDGLIQPRDKGRITSCAARSNRQR
jgi:hypothetical protein